MKNGFGFKDFVFFVLLLGIALSMWLLMVQRDRQWVLLQRVDDRLLELEKRIQQLFILFFSTICKWCLNISAIVIRKY